MREAPVSWAQRTFHDWPRRCDRVCAFYYQVRRQRSNLYFQVGSGLLNMCNEICVKAMLIEGIATVVKCDQMTLLFVKLCSLHPNHSPGVPGSSLLSCTA